eukprot:223226_1
MTATLVSAFIYVSLRTILSQQFFQTAHLKPSSAATVSGITVNTGPGATVFEDQWNINVVSQQGSDLNIVMDSRWGFHPLFPSSIQLYIQGITSNETYQTDGEILFVFNVNQQYFAQMISIDERKSSYKECPNSNTQLITRDVTEMLSASVPDRYHRYCKNAINTPRNEATDNWDNVGTSSVSYKQPAQWPMWLTITNDPISNTVTYGWSDALNGLNKVSSTFTSSFITSRGMNIFISGESPNEDFVISSVDVTYRYDVTTDHPTPFPSSSPTHKPSNKPTQDPTTSLPTRSPTAKPSAPPTSRPSVSPTSAPSWSPTIVGETRSPTTNAPSFAPSIRDTVAPIQRTEFVNFAETKIVIVSDGKEGTISWLQAMIIIVAVFVFIVAWVGFCAFVFFVKRKSKSKSKVKRKPSDSVQSQGEEDQEMETPAAEYAHDDDDNRAMIHEHIPDFLNIKMPQEFNNGYAAQHQQQITPSGMSGSHQQLQPQYSLNPKYIRPMEYSETDMVSETDELSRHDMIYIPGKQTQYREKYRRSIMQQQTNKQFNKHTQYNRRYKASASIDI